MRSRSGYEVSQQKAQLIKEKEGTNLLNTQDSNATSKPAACDYMETVPVGQTYRKNHWMMQRIPGFIDGSRFVIQGNCKAGYAVTATDQVIEAKPLPVGTSAQKAEITALTRTLNIWTDAKYAFGAVPTHDTIWKEQGLLIHKENKSMM
uniref:RNase H type-1 domain-containing protein n=1 Tax=Gallus gallus TaxID=9031 RepID=A0A8V0YRF5_CHICK